MVKSSCITVRRHIELELERRGPNHLIKCIVWNYLQQITYG